VDLSLVPGITWGKTMLPIYTLGKTMFLILLVLALLWFNYCHKKQKYGLEEALGGF
jgi:hypothetical protein